MMRIYKVVDFTFCGKTVNDYKIPFLDDVMFPSFENNLWNVYDLVFIKGNRMKN
jgi:hypothetical protein